MKSNKDALLDAALLVETQGGWCRDYLARDAAGEGCFYDDEEAVSFCAVGALCRASNTTVQAGELVNLCAAKLRLKDRTEHLATWNNQVATSGAEVGRLFRSVAATL